MENQKHFIEFTNNIYGTIYIHISNITLDKMKQNETANFAEIPVIIAKKPVGRPRGSVKKKSLI